MSNNQKSLKAISIVEMVVGLVYVVEGVIVSADKSSYFLSGLFTLLTGFICYLAVTDASKAKLAKILLWINIIANFVAIVGGFITHAGGMLIGTAVVDLCIIVYMLQLLKKIHG